MGKTKKKGNKKQEKPKNPICNIKPQLPKRGKELIGHVNGRPIHSYNGCDLAVVTDEMKNAKLRCLNCKINAVKGK